MEKELILKAINDAYAFVKEQKQSKDGDELLITLFKAKALVEKLPIHDVSNNHIYPKRYCKGCIKDVTDTMWCECGEQALNQNSTFSEEEAFEM